MKLVVGLGNPGQRHARNRHNVGFLAVDAIAAGSGLPWRAKFQGQIAEARFPTGKALLLKPETYMNLSGDSVQAALAFHKLRPSDLVVLHDELDLPPGKVRVKTGGGHAGHNGLRSIAAHVGPDFARVRIGIGHPGDKAMVSNYVLSDFAKAEADWLDPLLDAVARNAADLAAGDLAHFAASLGREPPVAKPAPPPPARPPAEPSEADDARSPLQKLIDRFS